MRMKRVMKCFERIICDDDKFPRVITVRWRAIEKTPFKLEERRWKRKYDLIRSMEGTCQVTALGLSLIPHPFQRCPFFLTRRCWFVHHTAKNIAIFPKVLYKNVDGQRSYLVFHIGRCPTEKHNKR